jgi:ATP synthase protein I
MLCGVFAGRWLDKRFHTGLLYIAPLLMLGAAAGCWWGWAGTGCK